MNDDASQIVELLREIRDLLARKQGVSGGSDVEQAKGRRVSPARSKGHQDPVPDSVVDRVLGAKGELSKWEPIWERGKSLDKWLACLLIAEELNGGAAALTAGDITRLAVERFRVAGVHTTNVNRDLRNARSYVNRRRGPRGYEHTLNRKGITYIEARIDELARTAAT